MTVSDYIRQKLSAFGALTEADLADVSSLGELSPDDEYSESNALEVGKALISLLADKILSPYQKSISENGISFSWDFSNVGKYYLSLCKKYGVTPDPTIIETAGINLISDKTSLW